MTEADFGFDEDEWMGEDGEKDAETGSRVTEVLPQLQITDAMSQEEKMKILRTRYPEFEHISREYLSLQPLHDELAAAANAAQRLIKSRKSGSETLPTPMAVTKHRACAAYLAAMAMYFAVLGSTAKDNGSPVVALDPTELHEHPVMTSLLKCQRMWTKIESLPVSDPLVNVANGEDLSPVEETSPLADEIDAIVNSQPKTQKQSKAQRAAKIAQAEAEARRAARLAKTEQDLEALATLADKAVLKKSKKKKRTSDQKLNLLDAEDSDFGEETSLTAHELAEKANKKKSLRFYTSQIAQKANKRDAAGKDYGGDADIPHRERLKDRQARLQAEAEKRAQHGKQPGAVLGQGDDDSGNESPPPRNEDYDDEDGYYDMIAAKSDAKKEDKSKKAQAYAEAAKLNATVVEQEIVGEDGRRMISYMIEKNKGYVCFFVVVAW